MEQPHSPAPPPTSFNTASGMDCMQSLNSKGFSHGLKVSIPQAVWIACNYLIEDRDVLCFCFNTASGMDCMQLFYIALAQAVIGVSIPQAVWIACNFVFSRKGDSYYGFNTASGMDCMQ